MSATPAVRRQHHADVRYDWTAWLPDESEYIFNQLQGELAAPGMILAVLLNEALTAASSDSALSPEAALLFLSLFDRLAAHLEFVLTALEDHGRDCGTNPNAAPLCPDYFRSRAARRLARMARWRSHLLVFDSSLFVPKLGAIRQVVSSLHAQARAEACAIAEGRSQNAREGWARLEVLQYDLNTCLQETTVALKSFFCALPGHELPRFRTRLLS